MAGTLRLGRIGGIGIDVNFSILLIFAIISWSLAVTYFPVHYPEIGAPSGWLLGAATAILLFGSVLVHELGHAFVAHRRGITVSSITLFVFGGVAKLASEPRRPLDEFLIAAAGPTTSLLLASLCYLASLLLQGTSMGLAVVLGYLAAANLVLGLFNLAPGFPLDGGRVLRSLVWQLTGSADRASRVAVAVGRAVAYLLIVFGVLQVFGGNGLTGIWLALIGWFMLNGARAGSQQATFEQQLGEITVRDAMRPDPVAVERHTSVQRLVDEYLLHHTASNLPVVEGGYLVGTVSLQEVAQVPAEAWRAVEVGSVMNGQRVPNVVAPDDPLGTAIQHFDARNPQSLLVVADGRLVGTLDRSGVACYLQIRALRERGQRARSVATAEG